MRGTQVTSVSNCAKDLFCVALPGLLSWRSPHRFWSSWALMLADELVTGRCFRLPPASRLTELPEEIKCLLFYFISCQRSLLLTEGVGWLGRSPLWVWRKAARSSPMVGSRELREPPCPLSLCGVSLAGEEKPPDSLEGLQKVQMDEEGNVAAHFRTFVKFLFSCLLCGLMGLCKLPKLSTQPVPSPCL